MRLLAGIMAIMAARFYRNPSNTTARSLFRASLLYMPVFMVGLVAHRTPDRRLEQLEALAEPSEDAEQHTAAQIGDHGSRHSSDRRVFLPPWPLLPVPSRDPR